MNHTPARNTRKHASRVTAVLVALAVATIGTLVYQSTSALVPPFSEHAGGGDSHIDATADGVVNEADGVLPDNTSVFDDSYPGIANLDPALLQAMRAAATEATHDGIEFTVNSGWRSAEYQEQLLREAISEYGSRAEAARWVATPDTSAHVSGDAIDIGPFDAIEWLSKHGARYGMCQVYRNESWHYELRQQAIDHGCPAMYADPTEDPRMQG